MEPSLAEGRGSRWAALFTNGYLALYAIDASVSVGESLLRAATGSEALLLPRNLVAYPVVFLGMASFPLLILCPKLPARIFLPLFLVLWWIDAGSAPLVLLLDYPEISVARAAAQLLASVVVFGLIWRYNARAGRPGVWWSPLAPRPWFSLRHTAALLAFTLLLLPPLAFAHGVLVIAQGLEYLARPYLAYHPSGITLADRTFVKDGKRVRFVGMMHIGEDDLYRELVATFSEPSTVVLMEGVTDESGRMKGELEYETFARNLGLDAQDYLPGYLMEDGPESLPEWPVWRYADVDMAEFSPQTIAWLELTARVLSTEPLWRALLFIVWGPTGSDDLADAMWQDLIVNRNNHLASEIDVAIAEFDQIVIPWGALHLADLEKTAVNLGFELESESRHWLVKWFGDRPEAGSSPATASFR